MKKAVKTFDLAAFYRANLFLADHYTIEVKLLLRGVITLEILFAGPVHESHLLTCEE